MDISRLLQPSDHNPHSAAFITSQTSITSKTSIRPSKWSTEENENHNPHSAASITSETQTSIRTKWSEEENQLLINLRGQNMKWEDISVCLQGRTALSCRLHFQNSLERKFDWTEAAKDKLARLYARYVFSFCIALLETS